MTTNAPLPPLFFERIFRIAAGLACLMSIPFVPAFEYTWLGVLALVVAGATFVVAGLTANPGCEITALPNLFLPARRRLHCFCPLFTPLDRASAMLPRSLPRTEQARISVGAPGVGSVFGMSTSRVQGSLTTSAMSVRLGTTV